MSTDHHHHHHHPLTYGTPPPNSTDDHHYQSPPSSTIGNPSPTITPTNSVETNTTPESRIAAAIGRAIFNIRSNCVKDALAAASGAAAINNPLIRTTSDANSSVNQDPSSIITTTTPPKVPINNNPLRRTLSDSITTDYQQHISGTNKPTRRSLSDSIEHQEFKKTEPESSTGKLSPYSKRMKKLENMVMKFEQRCLEIPSEDDSPNPTQVIKDDYDESIGVERLKNGDVKFKLDCSCGKHFEMLIKQNGYCFYKLP